MRLMITGVTGFIGHAVLSACSQAGLNIRAAVRCVGDCSLPIGIDTVEVPDIGPDTDWRDALEGVDIVLHLAGRAHHVSRAHDRDSLAAFRRVNTAGTMCLAKAAATAGVYRFIFISSIGVNGNETVAKAFSETDPPTPQEDYAVSKREAEEGLKALAAETGMQVVIIRPPLVYGPNAPGNFGRLCRLVQRGLPLPLGAIHNRRSLVALDNLVDFIITCIEHPAAANQIFLVSDGEDLSTTDLIGRLARTMGRPAWLIPVPVKMLEIGAALLGKRAVVQRLCDSLQVDITKARTLLDWTPPVSVDESLGKTMVPFLRSQSQ